MRGLRDKGRGVFTMVGLVRIQLCSQSMCVSASHNLGIDTLLHVLPTQTLSVQ